MSRLGVGRYTRRVALSAPVDIDIDHSTPAHPQGPKEKDNPDLTYRGEDQVLVAGTEHDRRNLGIGAKTTCNDVEPGEAREEGGAGGRRVNAK